MLAHLGIGRLLAHAVLWVACGHGAAWVRCTGRPDTFGIDLNEFDMLRSVHAPPVLVDCVDPVETTELGLSVMHLEGWTV